MKVLVFTDWTTPEGFYNSFLKQSKDGRGNWGNVELVSSEPADVYVIINRIPWMTPEEAVKRYPRAYYFLMEPYPAPEWANARSYFEPARFLTHDKWQNVGEWHLGLTYDEIRSDLNLKYDLVSTIQSTKNFEKGHKLRLSLIDELNRSVDFLYCYGSYHTSELKNYRGTLPPHQKERGLSNYKYHIAVENNAIPNYFTEKIIDGILMDCLVFYWGCPNLEDYIPPRAFVRLSLTSIEDDIALIRRAVAENWWDSRIGDIRRAKTIFLNELQFFPMMERILYP